MSPAVELIRTIEPPPRSRRWGIAATQVFQVPVRLTPTTVSQTTGSTSSQRCTVQTPALATTASRPPSRAAPSATAVFSASVSRTSTSAVTTRPPTSSTRRLVCSRSSARGERVGDRLQVRADVECEDVGALAGQADCVVATLAPPGTGDQHDLAADPILTGHSLGCRNGHEASLWPAASTISRARRRPSRTASSAVRGATQSPARSSAFPFPVNCSSGRRWPQSTTLRHATRRCSPVQTCSRRA